MKTNLQDVLDFHNKFQVPMATVPSFLDPRAHEFRVNFLHEELKEFEDSYNENDLAGCADALVDLVYIALGTALLMGIPWQQVWDRVQLANMTKRLAKPDGSDSKRGNPLDVVKPPGWVGPDHSSLNQNPRVFNATEAVQTMASLRKSLGELIIVKVSRSVSVGGKPQAVVESDSLPVPQLSELTPELEELFGHRQVLYFEASLSPNGFILLGRNVAPPHAG